MNSENMVEEENWCPVLYVHYIKCCEKGQNIVHVYGTMTFALAYRKTNTEVVVSPDILK